MSIDNTPTPRAVPHPAKPRTDAEERLWQALLDDPDSTAADLSTAAGIGRSTAPKILSRWQKEGIVTRTAGISTGGLRPADRWSVAMNDQPVDDQPAAADETRTTGEVEPKRQRLASGELRGMVEDYLRENDDQDFSPNTIGKALNRSAGAVHNALEKLVKSGYAVRTSDKPKKYAFSSADSAAN